jgi:hypothetical protein
VRIMVSVPQEDVVSLACGSEVGASMRLNLGLGPITRDGTRHASVPPRVPGCHRLLTGSMVHTTLPEVSVLGGVDLEGSS